ncbi:hypothetical protein EV356DRAFT_497993 [Viridothelium virens]|uniref:Uncharacterized protein n=1 Tax=Viridothelium virens TaxID=1048519 RepID=A0A6A6HF67_VIRVR|nr:hypothetical protein EV356DRAFT_497993 [Viridothelium virens]
MSGSLGAEEGSHLTYFISNCRNKRTRQVRHQCMDTITLRRSEWYGAQKSAVAAALAFLLHVLYRVAAGLLLICNAVLSLAF